MKDRLLIIFASVVVAIGGIAVAAQATESTPFAAVFCPAGADLLVHPDGTWTCGTTPTTAPSATPSAPPTATQTPTPTTAPPTTPSPSPSTTTAPPSPTATPRPSPTTTARLTNCFTRLEACGYPSRTTTGVPASVTLQPYLGPIPLVITTAGTVLDGKTLPCVVVKAANVVIRNSKITGTQCWGNVSVDAGNVTVENTTIDCVDQRGTGIDNQNFTARRVKILNCQNGFDVYGSNITIEDSYITGVGGGDGHGDGLQMNNGTNMLVRHNVFELPGDLTSSLIMGFQATNLTVTGNFFSGGAFSVYCSRANTNVLYSGNRFYPQIKGDPLSPAFGTNTNCAGVAGITWTGNYRDDTLGTVAAT